MNENRCFFLGGGLSYIQSYTVEGCHHGGYRFLPQTFLADGDRRTRDFSIYIYIFFFFSSCGGWGKNKAKVLTTLPRAFIHVLRQLTSVVLSNQPCSLRILQFTVVATARELSPPARSPLTTPAAQYRLKLLEESSHASGSSQFSELVTLGAQMSRPKHAFEDMGRRNPTAVSMRRSQKKTKYTRDVITRKQSRCTTFFS